MGQKANYYALTIDYTQTATGGDTCPFPAVANMFFVSIGESEKNVQLLTPEGIDPQLHSFTYTGIDIVCTERNR